MSYSYTHYKKTMFKGTMRREGDPVWRLFQLFLSEKDGVGEVHGTWDHFAFHCGWETEEDRGKAKFEAAVGRLMDPDPESTSQDEDGRRVIQLGPNHYKLVNFAQYDEDYRAEIRRAKDRARKQSKKDASRNAEREKPRPRTPKDEKRSVPVRSRPGVDADVALRSFIRVVEGADREPDDNDREVLEHVCRIGHPRDMVNCLQWAKTHKFWAGTLIRFKQLGQASESGALMCETIWTQYQATLHPGENPLLQKKAELEAELEHLSPKAETSRAAVQKQIDTLAAKLTRPSATT